MSQFVIRTCEGCEVTAPQPLRERTVSDGSKRATYQCLRCGRGSDGIKYAPGLPPFDDELWHKRNMLKTAQASFNRLAFSARQRWYRDEYMKSAHWRKTRAEAIDRALGRCELCPDRAEQVHHLNYERIGREAPEDLMAVCRACHESLEFGIGITEEA